MEGPYYIISQSKNTFLSTKLVTIHYKIQKYVLSHLLLVFFYFWCIFAINNVLSLLLGSLHWNRPFHKVENSFWTIIFTEHCMRPLCAPRATLLLALSFALFHSQLSNKQVDWNKRAGWNFSSNLINKLLTINIHS